MAERIGRYGRDTRVRFTEGLIDRAGDWQWFIECTEEEFDAPKEIASVGDFNDAFFAVREPYICLASIVDVIGDFKPDFSAPWLKKVYDHVLLRSGLLRPEDLNEHEGFYGMLGVASYATLLFNKLAGTHNLIDTRILYYSNLHQLLDFGDLRDDRARLDGLVEAINLPGVENVAETLRSSFEGIDVPVDADRVKALMDASFDDNFLNFKSVKGELFQTWQETLLHNALRTSFKADDIEPMMRFGNGGESPNVSDWTEEALSLAKDAFCDERAICVLETVELGIWGKAPSKRSQEILVDLALGRAESCLNEGKPVHSLRCTAFDAIEYLRRGKSLINKAAKDCYFRSMAKLLGDLVEYHDLKFLDQHLLPMTKEQKALFEEKIASFFKDGLARADSARALIGLYGNPLSAKHCSQEDAQRSLELFNGFTQEVDVMTAELFYSAMVFFLDVLGSNQEVDKDWVRSVIISLRHAWQDRYYSRVVSGMQHFSHSISVPQEDTKSMNEAFLAEPQGLAHSLMLRTDEEISKTLEEMSEHVIVYMFSRTTISEYYPDHDHVTFRDDERCIDKMIADEVRRVYKERSYRLVNSLGDQELIDGFFSRLSGGIQLVCNMIDVAPAYDGIVANAPGHYELLPNPGTKPTLGHLAQLFPLLENTIRDIGEFFNIVPFQADKASFNNLKDAATILGDMTRALHNLTGTVQGCNEFLFVYYVMYSHNGFNVRNDCIHGRRYQDPSSVALAYRLTVICAYMMLKRLVGLKAIAEKGED